MDYGHTWTEKELEKLERRISREYDLARKSVKKRASEYLDAYQSRYERKQAQYKAGKITKEELKTWRQNQLAYHRSIKDLENVLAQDLTNADAIALRMVNDSNIDVYAFNANYGTYEIENGLHINTSFALYDHDTVERLFATGEASFMPVNPNIPKDLRWNKKQINSAITQGILTGESVPKIAKRLQAVTDMDERAAIRNARTYTTSAENAGRVDSYERADRMGIKLGQQWVATPDNRVRDSHALLDGEIIGVNTGECFSNGCRYPADPRGRPEEVYNCRCTLVAALEGFNNDINDLSQRFSRLPDMTYDEWKASHMKIKPAEPTGTKTETPEVLSTKTFKERIQELLQGKTDIDTETIYKAGKEFSKEVDEYLKQYELTDEQRKDIQRKIDLATEKLDDLNKQISSLEDELYNLVDPEWQKKNGYTDFSQVYQRRKQLSKKHTELLQEKWKYEQAIDNTREMLKSGTLYRKGAPEHAEFMSKKLGEIRSVGYKDGRALDAHLNKSRSPVKSDVIYAYQHYPTDWVQASIDEGKLSPRKVNRGYYSGWSREICISGWDESSLRETAFHELGHRFEDVVKGIRPQEKEFYAKRTAGEMLEWLGAGYDRTEVTRKDNFLHKYMGKDYGGSFYELVSMGFEYAYTDPRHLAQDKDMQEWILGLLITQ